MRTVSSLAVRALLAALIVACCAPFGRFGAHDAGPPLAPVPPVSATDPAHVPVAAAGCPGQYHLELGPAVSPTSPYLAEHLHEGEQMPTGYVAAELTRNDDELFTPCRIRVGIYQYRLGSRRLVLEDPRDLHGTEASFMKSWHIPNDGEFEVVVTDDVTAAILARQRFPVRAAPAPAVHPGATVCSGTYDSVIGPAESPTSPYLAERLHRGDVLHAPVYVAIELSPHRTGHFPACRMRFALYDYAEDGKRLVVESEREMSTGEGVFNKSWIIRQAGRFEIAVSDVNGGGTRIATEGFTVTE